jgi:hypothetical protein
MTAIGSFSQAAPRIMETLIRTLGIGKDDAAAILGNLGHETGGFQHLQELRPTAGRGGYGIAQWTGPRRVAFERWAAARGLSQDSLEANTGFLLHELQTTEAQSLVALRNAGSLWDKTVAFETAFERAGIKAHASRYKWAQRALSAYAGGSATVEIGAGGAGGAGAGGVAMEAGLPWWGAMLISAAVLILVVVVVRKLRARRKPPAPIDLSPDALARIAGMMGQKDKEAR